MSERHYWCCPDCDSVNVEMQVWANPNTREISDDTERYSWCHNCDTELEYRNGLRERPWSETAEGKAGEPEPEDGDTPDTLPVWQRGAIRDAVTGLVGSLEEDGCTAGLCVVDKKWIDRLAELTPVGSGQHDAESILIGVAEQMEEWAEELAPITRHDRPMNGPKCYKFCCGVRSAFQDIANDLRGEIERLFGLLRDPVESDPA